MLGLLLDGCIDLFIPLIAQRPKLIDAHDNALMFA